MSHEIEMIDGIAQMAYTGEVPWHGLGVKVSNDLSPQQMLKAAGLDWQVEPRPCYTRIGDKEVKIDRQALVRDTDEKILDIISPDWKPVQNHQAFDFFNEFVAAGHMNMETAGSLKDGKIVFALAKVNESFDLFKGKDQIDGYLHFTNPHSYGKSIDVRFTPIRVVCWNTLTLSLNTKVSNVAKWNHRREFNEEIVKETLGIAKEKLKSYKEMATFLSEKQFKNEDIVEYFTRIFPVSGLKTGTEALSRNARFAIDEAMENQPGAELGRGSFWQMFNAVTFMTDHTLGRSADTRLESAWYGSNSNLKVKALEVAVEMAEKV